MLHHKTIPTQWAFLTEKTPNGYRVQRQALEHSTPIPETFGSKEEAEAFINNLQEIV